jgi:molybdopterin molybdotransferase
MIDRADNADILISSGGVSGGAYDLVRSCIEARHGEILFHGLEMRPGKPLLFARLTSGALYFGLPGNPVAALVGFRFFVLEAARAALGLPAETGTPVVRSVAATPGPTRFLRVRVACGADGSIRWDDELDQRSHILSSAAAADAWLRRDDANGIDTLFPKRPGRLT